MASLDLTNPVDIWLSHVYHYRPDIYGNSTQVVLFSLGTILIAVLNAVYSRRTGNPAKYMHLITFTGLMEVVGYALRIYASLCEDVSCLNTNAFIVTTVAILIAPIFLATVNYVVVGKLLKATGKSVLCIKASHATCFFLTADILCFLIQCSAAALLTSKNPSQQDQGKSIVLLGLGLQLFFFTGFAFIALYMAFSKKFSMMTNQTLRPVFIGLFVSIICLYIRNVYRCVEFASGYNSDLVKHELIFFLLETLPILVAFGAYIYYHFGRDLPSDAELPLAVKTPASKADQSMADVEMQQVE